MQSRYEITTRKPQLAQHFFIINYNFLVQELGRLGIELQKLNEKGVCFGLNCSWQIAMRQDAAMQASIPKCSPISSTRTKTSWRFMSDIRKRCGTHEMRFYQMVALVNALTPQAIEDICFRVADRIESNPSISLDTSMGKLQCDFKELTAFAARIQHVQSSCNEVQAIEANYSNQISVVVRSAKHLEQLLIHLDNHYHAHFEDMMFSTVTHSIGAFQLGNRLFKFYDSNNDDIPEVISYKGLASALYVMAKKLDIAKKPSEPLGLSIKFMSRNEFDYYNPIILALDYLVDTETTVLKEIQRTTKDSLLETATERFNQLMKYIKRLIMLKQEGKISHFSMCARLSYQLEVLYAIPKGKNGHPVENFDSYLPPPLCSFYITANRYLKRCPSTLKLIQDDLCDFRINDRLCNNILMLEITQGSQNPYVIRMAIENGDQLFIHSHHHINPITSLVKECNLLSLKIVLPYAISLEFPIFITNPETKLNCLDIACKNALNKIDIDVFKYLCEYANQSGQLLQLLCVNELKMTSLLEDIITADDVNLLDYLLKICDEITFNHMLHKKNILQHAIEAGSFCIFKYLIEKGANLPQEPIVIRGQHATLGYLISNTGQSRFIQLFDEQCSPLWETQNLLGNPQYFPEQEPPIFSTALTGYYQGVANELRCLFLQKDNLALHEKFKDIYEKTVFFCARGVDPTIKDIENNNALFYLIRSIPTECHSEYLERCFQYLVDKGCEVNEQHIIEAINRKIFQIKTPLIKIYIKHFNPKYNLLERLMSAIVMKSDIESLKLLMDNGLVNVDSFFKEYDNGENLFHVACKEGAISIVQLLLPVALSLINKRTVNCQRQTALHLSATHGHLEIVRLLIQYGADTEAFDAKNNKPLQAALWSHVVFVFLLKHTEIKPPPRAKASDFNMLSSIISCRAIDTELAKITLELFSIPSIKKDFLYLDKEGGNFLHNFIHANKHAKNATAIFWLSQIITIAIEIEPALVSQQDANKHDIVFYLARYAHFDVLFDLFNKSPLMREHVAKHGILIDLIVTTAIKHGRMDILDLFNHFHILDYDGDSRTCIKIHSESVKDDNYPVCFQATQLIIELSRKSSTPPKTFHLYLKHQLYRAIDGSKWNAAAAILVSIPIESFSKLELEPKLSKALYANLKAIVGAFHTYIEQTFRYDKLALDSQAYQQLSQCCLNMYAMRCGLSVLLKYSSKWSELQSLQCQLQEKNHEIITKYFPQAYTQYHHKGCVVFH